MISLVATIPAAVADNLFNALSDSRNGAKDPSTTFQATNAHTGTETFSSVPPREAVVVNVSPVNVHQRENGAQNTVATLMVQNERASGEMVFSWRSPTRK